MHRSEFYVRRIIFWKDEEREFEKEWKLLELPDVKLVRLTENNNFAVKKLLLKDDLHAIILFTVRFRTKRSRITGF